MRLEHKYVCFLASLLTFSLITDSNRVDYKSIFHWILHNKFDQKLIEKLPNVSKITNIPSYIVRAAIIFVKIKIGLIENNSHFPDFVDKQIK